MKKNITVFWMFAIFTFYASLVTSAVSATCCTQDEEGGQCVEYVRNYFCGDSETMPGLCQYNTDCGAYNAWGHWDLGFGSGRIPANDSVMILSKSDSLTVGHVAVVTNSRYNSDGTYTLTVQESNWDLDEKADCDVTYTFYSDNSEVTRESGSSRYSVSGFIYGSEYTVPGDMNGDDKLGMEDIICGLQILSGMRLQQNERYFKNITDVYLDALSSEVQDNSLHLFNLRIKSDDTALDDLIKLSLSFDNKNQIFSIDSVDTLKGVGVYNEPHFAKDVTSEIYMYKDSQQFEMDETYTITSSGEEYYMDLEIGQVLSFYIADPDNDFIRKVKDPDNEEISSYIQSKGQGTISGEIPVFKTGQYIVQFIPLSSQNVTIEVRFLNANRRTIEEIYNSSYITTSFKKNIKDYMKYKVFLNSGELLSLDKPADSDISINIINSKSEYVAGGNGLPVKYIADSDDDYYIFIYNKKGWGESYKSTVSITSTDTGKREILRGIINYKQSDFNATPAKP